MGALARITTLFQEGQALPLTAGETTLVVWIAKLSPFEVEEARQDGRVAKARMVLAIKEIGSPEFDVFRSTLVDVSDDAILEVLLDSKSTEWAAGAMRKLRADKDWGERLEIIEHTDPSLLDPADPQVALVAKVSVEFTDKMDELTDVERTQMRADLIQLPRKELEERYEQEYLDRVGMGAFITAYQRAEVFFALRECVAAEHTIEGDVEEGRWNHGKCDHLQRICQTREQVADLPESFWVAVRRGIDALNVPTDVARFSAAPESSSASSEQPSGPEAESTPSTQEETLAVPAGIL